MPPLKKVELSLLWSISACAHTLYCKKNYVFIAAILSELHAPWQPVMQGYVIGLTTLNRRNSHSEIFSLLPCHVLTLPCIHFNILY